MNGTDDETETEGHHAMRNALRRLAADEPAEPFGAHHALAAGRRARRRRTALFGGVVAAAGLATAAAVTVPMIVSSNATHHPTRISAAPDRGTSVGHLKPAALAAPLRTLDNASAERAGAPANRRRRPVCPVASPRLVRQWSAYRSQVEATVQHTVGGTLKYHGIDASTHVCMQDQGPRGAAAGWWVLQGRAAGDVSVGYAAPVRGTYATYQDNPCAGAVPRLCRVERHGDGVLVVRHAGSATSQQSGTVISVTFARSDNSVVSVTASTKASPQSAEDYDHPLPELSAPPLTETQLVTLATDPTLEAQG